VVCGPGGRHAERIQRELGGLAFQLFSEARRHVPQELVEKASAAASAFQVDAIVTLGGGSATGLGKALRLEHSFYFVAVPTTYAGSELTDLYGTTKDGAKRTARDPRVVPDVALYDVELTVDMPLALSVTSLMNALAHPVSALSTGKLDAPATERALEAAASVYSALAPLVADARSISGRTAAIEGTVRAGMVLRSSPVGLHHEMAHALGGRFDLDHASLHSVLLPHSIAWLGHTAPERLAMLRERLGEQALPGSLLHFLQRSAAPTSLAALGVTRAGLDALCVEKPNLPRELLESAWAGDLS
jgi:maleylacetate reductase